MTNFNGTIEFENDITVEQMEIIEKTFSGAVFLVDPRSVEIDDRLAFIDLETLIDFQKKIEESGNKLEAGEICLWLAWDQGSDVKYCFLKAENKWIRYEESFLCDLTTEELIKELHRRQAEEMLDPSPENIKYSDDDMPTLEDDLPEGAICSYEVYRMPGSFLDVTKAKDEDEAIDNVYEDYGCDRDDFYAERRTVSSYTRVNGESYGITAATYVVPETNELGVQIVFPDGVLQTVSCKPSEGEMR